MERENHHLTTVMIRKNRALVFLEKGLPQFIDIDQKTVLDKMMTVLGSKAPPKYSQIDCGPNGVKISINLEPSLGLTAINYDVEGEVFTDRDAAESSAIQMAFSKLATVYHIQVLDYSSQVAVKMSSTSTSSNLAEALRLVNKILDKFDVASLKCKEFGIELERKEMQERFRGNVHGLAHKYNALSAKLLVLASDQSIQSFCARRKLIDSEQEMLKQQQNKLERKHQIENMGYLQKVAFPAKDTLNYILKYFGFGQTSYTSSRHRSGKAKAVVEFTVPYMDSLKICGVIHAKAKGASSVIAEENAAMDALMMLEKNFNIRIVDLNRQERMAAENSEKRLMAALEEIVTDTGIIHKVWDTMNTAINEEVQESSNTASVANIPAEKLEAWKYCNDNLRMVAQVSDECKKECREMFDKVKEMGSELIQTKMSLYMLWPEHISNP